MKTKLLFLPLLFLFLTTPLLSQNETTRTDPQRKNSIYVQNFYVLPSVCYDRMIPLSPKFGMSVKAAVGFIGTVFEGNAYYKFTPKHYVEAGTGWWVGEGMYMNLNYRYMATKGFLLLAGFQYIQGEEAMPSFGLGYSF